MILIKAVALPGWQDCDHRRPPWKHAVILAHPDPKSLNAAIARTYAETVRELGDEVVERDLYAMRFDPCLKAAEISGPKLPRFRVDVVRERVQLEDVEDRILAPPPSDRTR